jgi:acyl dehydratase
VDKTFPHITRAKLALYAGASGDHNPIHIDSDFAKRAGFPDVFSHGMLVMGLLGQALTDAVRPDRLRGFSTRFVAITQVGATIRCEGTLAELFEAEGERRAPARRRRNRRAVRAFVGDSGETPPPVTKICCNNWAICLASP